VAARATSISGLVDWRRPVGFGAARPPDPGAPAVPPGPPPDPDAPDAADAPDAPAAPAPPDGRRLDGWTRGASPDCFS